MDKRKVTLTRKLAWIVGLKLFFIFLIWWFFVAPHEVKVNDAQVFEHLTHSSNSTP
jgi:hypothetical protein